MTRIHQAKINEDKKTQKGTDERMTEEIKHAVRSMFVCMFQEAGLEGSCTNAEEVRCTLLRRDRRRRLGEREAS